MSAHSREKAMFISVSVVAGLALGAVPFACSIDVPVQSARVVQVESYTQTHHFQTNRESARREAGGILEVILGSRNRCAVERRGESALWSSSVDSLIVGDVLTHGHMVITASLDPWEPSAFYVEGVGRYTVERKSSELIASADFRIVDTGPFPLADLTPRDGSAPVLPILVEQHVVREIGGHVERYIHESKLALAIRLARFDDKVYGIDYCAYHEVGVVTDDEAAGTVSVYPVGCLKFDTPNDGRKLLDFREETLTIRKYEDTLKDAGKVRERELVPMLWMGSSACPICDGNKVIKKVDAPERPPDWTAHLPPILGCREGRTDKEDAGTPMDASSD